MEIIKYTRLQPDVDKPLLYALGHQDNPLYIKRELINGIVILKYRLPYKFHWPLRTIKYKLPPDLLTIVGKYLYRFNVYRLLPERTRSSYPKVEIVI